MKRKIFFVKLLVLIITTGFVFISCNSIRGSSMVTGNARPAISPADVRILHQPPAQYETIGTVSATGSSQGMSGLDLEKSKEMVIGELRNQAAKIGANGVLSVTFTLIHAGMGATSGVTGQGTAIHIIRQ